MVALAVVISENVDIADQRVYRILHCNTSKLSVQVKFIELSYQANLGQLSSMKTVISTGTV